MTKHSLSEPLYGNFEDKYHATNPISKLLMRGFLRAFDGNLTLLADVGLTSICEVGCGEGELLKRLHGLYPQASLAACDISTDEVAKAQVNSADFSVDFSVQNAEALGLYGDGAFDLVVCCEVLEHLENPEAGLRELYRISGRYVLVSVPHEPIWRMLNMARGKYLADFGNTPGHLNHWEAWQFLAFLGGQAGFSIFKKGYPLPWQMVLLAKNV